MDVMFSNESKFNIIRSKSCLVRRGPWSDRYKPRFTIMEWKLVPKKRARGCLHYQQDRARCHTAKQFFKKERVPLLAWPGNSPNLNLIENKSILMKDILQKKIYWNIDALKKELIGV